MINKEQKQSILASIGLADNDRYKARFFMHEIPDLDNESIRQAQKLADGKAQKLTDIQGKYKAPDYSVENLVRLGAKQTHKQLLYVEIKRVGAKDFRSMEATEQHKQQFETEYNKYLSENKVENISERRQNIPVETSGFNNGKANFNQGFGSFSYTIDC